MGGCMQDLLRRRSLRQFQRLFQGIPSGCVICCFLCRDDEYFCYETEHPESSPCQTRRQSCVIQPLLARLVQMLRQNWANPQKAAADCSGGRPGLMRTAGCLENRQGGGGTIPRGRTCYLEGAPSEGRQRCPMCLQAMQNRVPSGEA